MINLTVLIIHFVGALTKSCKIEASSILPVSTLVAMTAPLKDVCPCFCQVPSIATGMSESPLTYLASLAAICIHTVATVSIAISNPDYFSLNLCDGVDKFITPHKTLTEDLPLPIHLIAYESLVLTS
ncbi:hypothetical protein TNCV_490601 [Trichonephila clavipes]|nr:hypothetical protein TNCV_490601 [Trichonephila clavipes]